MRVASFGCLILLAGCSLRMGDFTAISSRNVLIPNEPVGMAVEGKDCVYMLFNFIPIGSLIPNVEEAAERALVRAPSANALTNIAMYSDPIFIPYILTVNCLRVKGDAVRVPVGGAQ